MLNVQIYFSQVLSFILELLLFVYLIAVIVLFIVWLKKIRDQKLINEIENNLKKWITSLEISSIFAIIFLCMLFFLPFSENSSNSVMVYLFQMMLYPALFFLLSLLILIITYITFKKINIKYSTPLIFTCYILLIFSIIFAISIFYIVFFA